MIKITRSKALLGLHGCIGVLLTLCVAASGSSTWLRQYSDQGNRSVTPLRLVIRNLNPTPGAATHTASVTLDSGGVRVDRALITLSGDSVVQASQFVPGDQCKDAQVVPNQDENVITVRCTFSFNNTSYAPIPFGNLTLVKKEPGTARISATLHASQGTGSAAMPYRVNQLVLPIR